MAEFVIKNVSPSYFNAIGVRPVLWRTIIELGGHRYRVFACLPHRLCYLVHRVSFCGYAAAYWFWLTKVFCDHVYGRILWVFYALGLLKFDAYRFRPATWRDITFKRLLEWK